eukprot:gb/GFBE01076805.1/.p1 GENE.gb/GFBE01076805.1/~~gb/GFBE01076805.1/.p1  ORF type:complete len:216 (+),score=28.14 gb/GFBE01076805.1/:1-648(+)
MGRSAVAETVLALASVQLSICLLRYFAFGDNHGAIRCLAAAASGAALHAQATVPRLVVYGLACAVCLIFDVPSAFDISMSMMTRPQLHPTGHTHFFVGVLAPLCSVVGIYIALRISFQLSEHSDDERLPLCKDEEEKTSTFERGAFKGRGTSTRQEYWTYDSDSDADPKTPEFAAHRSCPSPSLSPEPRHHPREELPFMALFSSSASEGHRPQLA